MVNVLTQQKDKAFHWADYAFFMRWWKDQDETMRYKTKHLIEEDRFIFINGGWVMNDEAVPSYKQALIQMRLGLDMMNYTFGKRATIGWQVDPFGSSSVTISNLHKLGYDVFIGDRISQDYKETLRNKDGNLFYWEGHQVAKEKSESNLFSYMLQYHYDVPHTWFDRGFIEVDKSGRFKEHVFDIKIDRMIKSFNAITNDTISEYHVMVPMGGDFAYQDAEKVFAELDKFIGNLTEFGNSKGYNTTIKYGNLYEYFKVLKNQDLTYGQFKSDFLPYQENDNHLTWNYYWTGFYSTKLHLKRQIRHVFNELQTTKLFLAIRILNRYHSILNLSSKVVFNFIDHINDKIEQATKSFSILMHHDGITGTNKRITEADYYDLLDNSLKNIIQAREMIHLFRHAIDHDTRTKMKNSVSKLNNLEVFHYTVINPNGYERDEILNLTLPKSDNNDNYAFVIQHSFENKIDTNVTAYKIDLYNMDNDDKKPKVETKAFVKVNVPALGDTQIYLLKFSGDKQKCAEANIK